MRQVNAFYFGLLCLGLTLVCWNPNTFAASKPLSFCEVLHNLGKYRGKVIEVRGVFDGDLIGDCVPLKTLQYDWFNGIYLDFPSNMDGTPPTPR